MIGRKLSIFDPEYRDTHAHAGNTSPGSKIDKKHRNDASGPGTDSISAGIGHPFTPMVQTAPIHGFYAQHFTTACPACNVPILWAHVGDDDTRGECGGCHTVLKHDPEGSGYPVVA